VDNYPDKPILIAEYGTTEPADTPSVTWDQYGDNSDHNENRALWFKDMLSVIEEEFPAIRGLGLFNMNKELSWSLTTQDSTGIEAFNTGIESSHYTDEFLGARLVAIGAAIDADTLWRLENEPEENYDAALDGSFLPSTFKDKTDEGSGSANAATGANIKRFFSTDRLRTNVVVRNVIDKTTHRLSIEARSPNTQTLRESKATVDRYQSRYNTARGSRDRFRKQRLDLIDY